MKIEIDIDDIWEQISDVELSNEYENRFAKREGLVGRDHDPELHKLADAIYLRTIEVPQMVKDYIYNRTGRTLP